MSVYAIPLIVAIVGFVLYLHSEKTPTPQSGKKKKKKKKKKKNQSSNEPDSPEVSSHNSSKSKKGNGNISHDTSKGKRDRQAKVSVPTTSSSSASSSSASSSSSSSAAPWTWAGLTGGGKAQASSVRREDELPPEVPVVPIIRSLPDTTSRNWKVGMLVASQWRLDKHEFYYPAVIEEVTERGFVIKYTAYGNIDEVPASYLKPIGEVPALNLPSAGVSDVGAGHVGTVGGAVAVPAASAAGAGGGEGSGGAAKPATRGSVWKNVDSGGGSVGHDDDDSFLFSYANSPPPSRPPVRSVPAPTDEWETVQSKVRRPAAGTAAGIFKRFGSSSSSSSSSSSGGGSSFAASNQAQVEKTRKKNSKRRQKKLLLRELQRAKIS